MIPRGIEILVKKASVDDEFKCALLRNRSEAAGLIGLRLADSENAILNGIPEPQLRTIIDRARVKASARPAFMGYAATAMLAALVGGSIASAAEGDALSGEITSDGLSVNDGSIVVDDVTGTLIAYYYGETGIRPEEATLPEVFGKLLTIQYEGEVSGRSREDIVSEVTPVLQGPIAEEYGQERSVNDNAGLGEMIIQFKITKDGKITDFEVVSDEVNTPPVTNIVEDNLKTIQMKPASRDINVVYSVFLCLHGDG